MRNPWTKKNPFMSMWLSAANTVGGSVRSRATAEAKRQAAIATTKGVKQIIDFWSGGVLASSPRKKKKRR
jgi:hypothetical protein